MLQITTRLKRVFTVCFMACAIASCATDDDGPEDPENNNNNSVSFTAKVNGVDFNPQFESALLTTSISTLIVTGTRNDGGEIQLFIPSTLTPGTHGIGNPLEDSIIAFYQEADNDADDGAFASSGTVNITTLDTESEQISGTFSFTGTVENTGETIVITEGSFNLNWDEI